MSISVTSIKNPFQPQINEKRNYPFVKDRTVSYYLRHINLEADDIQFICTLKYPEDKQIKQININEINTIKVKDNCIVVIVAQLNYSVGLAVAAYIGATGVTAVVVAGAVAVAIAAAAYYGTALLIGANAPNIPSPTIPNSTETNREDVAVDQTYSWGDLKQTSKEGVRIAYLFGTNKISGHVINQFISVNGNNEILNILLGICDHEVDSITDIQINKQINTSFRGIQTFTRLGTFSDVAIPGFGEIVTQTNVGSLLVKDSGIVVKTSGNQVDKARIFITTNNGLFYSNDSGGLDSRTVTFTIEYRIVGAGSWTLFSNESKTASTTEPQRYTFDIDSLSANQYEFQVTRTNDPEESFRGNSDIYFTLFQEIVKEELIYPGLAKYAIQALATDQLSGGVPSFTCIASRDNVEIYNVDNGFWASKRATNPAWIVYALLNEFAEVPISKIIYDDFLEWADYCDELIDGVYRFIVNTVIYTGNFWKQIQRIAVMGRASIIRRGTRYGVFIDKEETQISDMFTMGDIIGGSFKQHFIPQKDRANVVEIEYTDPDREYNRQLITVHSDNYLDGSSDPKKVNLGIQASISQAQAIREGVFQINNNALLNEIIIFDAYVSSFAAITGDLIYFQHEIPHYELGLGGRIVNVGNDDGLGNPFVQMDEEFLIESGKTYSIMVRLRDNSIIEKIANNIPGLTNILTLTTPWAILPIISDTEMPTYSFGDVDLYKKIYRIISITRRDDFVRTLKILEYIPEIYTNNDGFTIKEIVDESIVQRATEVQLEENLIFSEFGDYKSNLAISWTTIKSGGFDWVIWLKDITANLEPIKIINTGNTTGSITSEFLIKNHEYLVYINTINEGPTNFFSNTKIITIQGKDLLPDDIESLFLQNNQLVWEYPGIINEIAGFKLKVGSGSNVSWTYAEFLNESNFVTSPWPITPRGETTTYLLKAYDYEDRESDVPAILITNLGDIIVQNVVEETTLSPPFDGDITNGQVITDVLYAINNGDFWQGDTENNIWKGVSGEIFFDSQYLEMTYIDRFTPIFTGIPVIIEVLADAPTGLLIFYREAQTMSFWEGNNNTSFWSGTSGNSFWDSSGADFRLLPIPVNLTEQPYNLKIVTNSGFEISFISEININYDFPDVVEIFEDISIESSGTRIPITKEYQVIKNVGLTLQDDAGDATSLIIADKDIDLGPLILAEDKDRTATTATIDVRIQGY